MPLSVVVIAGAPVPALVLEFDIDIALVRALARG